MKVRALNKVIKTNYILHNSDGCLCVGSPFLPKIITVNAETLEMKYDFAQAWENQRFSLAREPKTEYNTELLRIWDILDVMCMSGEIRQYLDGKDDIENPVTVYSVEGTRIVEHITDALEWPNTTDDGVLMYNNEFTSDYQKAVEMAKSEATAWIDMLKGDISRLQSELVGKAEQLAGYEAFLKELKNK